MPGSPLDPHRATGDELRRRFAAEADGLTFLIYRDGDDHQVLRTLDDAADRLVIGRSPHADIRIGWDRAVSSRHAELERVAQGWVIDDDGLSLNGTYVDARRIAGRHRLKPREEIRVGSTVLVFIATDDGDSTWRIGDPPPKLTGRQLETLKALCRPCVCDGRGYGATNEEIRAELNVELGTVKAHLRALFAAFNVPAEANHKRLELIERALNSGAVGSRDYA